MKKRPHYLFIVLFCIALIGAALFFQLVVGLEPCPLCIFQRIAIIAIAAIAFVALLHNSTGLADRFYGLLLVLAGLASLTIATRQVWLLNIPKEEAESCSVGLEVLLDKFIALLPQGQITETLLRSGAECTDVVWSLFGFSLPELTFPIFVVFSLYLIWLFFKRNDKRDYVF